MSKFPKVADHITIEACLCGCDQVYIYLHNSKGKAFACAPFEKGSVRAVADDLTAAADHISLAGEAHGHA